MGGVDGEGDGGAGLGDRGGDGEAKGENGEKKAMDHACSGGVFGMREMIQGLAVQADALGARAWGCDFRVSKSRPGAAGVLRVLEARAA
jgi:hypothetical protein